MRSFFREDGAGLDSNPAKWWQQHASRYPLLSSVARRFLSAPPTSVASERLFSSAGDVLTDSRSRLLPEKAEMLIFLKVNLNSCQ